MNLKPFHIEINQRPPFIGLFKSSAAAFETFYDLAFSESQASNGFKLRIFPFNQDLMLGIDR